jgi:hypothetical protein
MSAVYRITGTELGLSATGNTVSSSKLVRITNANNSITVLTVANTTATYANVSLTPYESITLEKAITDTVAGVNLKAVVVAYRN